MEEEARTEAANATQDVGEQKASVAACGLYSTKALWGLDRDPPDLMAGQRQAHDDRELVLPDCIALRAGPVGQDQELHHCQVPCWQAKASIQFKSRWGLQGPAWMTDRERAAEGTVFVPALKSPPATALFPAESRLCPVDSVHGTAPLNCM